MVMANQTEDLRRYLYPRGFLVSNATDRVALLASSLETWEAHRAGSFSLYCHPDTNCTVVRLTDRTLVLIGHVYNPWTGISDENLILRQLGHELGDDIQGLLPRLDELSGRFALLIVSGDSISVFHDCAGIQSVYYHQNGKEVTISSHSSLIADIHGMEVSDSIQSLVSSPFYSIGIRHLPGIKSPYDGVYLLTANTYLQAVPGNLRIHRYFPREPVRSVALEDATEIIADILVQSVRLLCGKSKLAVSLTGGLDSRMTLAATRGQGDRVTYFSYSSTPEEEADAAFAAKLCEALRLPHETYRIPTTLERDIDRVFAQIVHRNTAGVRNPSEYIKSIYLSREFPPDTIEIKSTVSEIGRKFYCKKLGVKSMPSHLTPRMMSNLYKRIAFDRKLLTYVDEAFEEFTAITRFGHDFMNYDQDDMFYWEHRLSAWQSLVVQDSDYSRDTTMLFNNRKLQQIFLGVEVEHRMSDRLQRSIVAHLWPDAAELPMATNTGSRSLRAKVLQLAERIFFRVN